MPRYVEVTIILHITYYCFKIIFKNLPLDVVTSSVKKFYRVGFEPTFTPIGQTVVMA